jgi:hypothetical protein
VFRSISAQPDAVTVAATWDTVRDQLASAFPKIGPLMDEVKAEVLAFTAFPRGHWPKVWSTNPPGRGSTKRRRARVGGISPTKPPSFTWSAPSLLIPTMNGKSPDRRYFCEGSMAKINRSAILEASPRHTGRRLTSRIPSNPHHTAGRSPQSAARCRSVRSKHSLGKHFKC